MIDKLAKDIMVPLEEYPCIAETITLRNAIIDRGVVIPEGMRIGFDPEEDRASGFRVTSGGKVLVTRGMLGLAEGVVGVEVARMRASGLFSTYRGGEAGHIYGRLLACLRHLFGADTFTIYPYQLGGDGNQEGLESGAWWFYQKLGFRARDKGVLRLMRRELARMKQNRRYRSSIATLEELAATNVFYDHGRSRDDVIGILPLGRLGLHGGRRQQGGDGHAACEQAQGARPHLGAARLHSHGSGQHFHWRLPFGVAIGLIVVVSRLGDNTDCQSPTLPNR